MRMDFLNTQVDNLTMDEALDRLEELISLNKNAYAVTPNVDHIVQLERGGELRDIYAQADLILTDGKPLVWISKLYGTPIKEKISGSDLFPLLCQRAARKGYKMFFLGADEGVAAKAAQNLTAKFPGLKVVGTYSPPLGFENDARELERIEEMIKAAAPHILVVGLGCPKQEKFIYHNRNRLGVPLSLGLGASLDFEAGCVKRAPKWMSDHGLEWLYRAVKEPKRLAKRYIVDAVSIAPIVWKYRKRK